MSHDALIDAPLEPERREVSLPGLVKSFVTYFRRYITDQNVEEIQNIYENSFNKLTEKFFRSSPWPPVAAVQQVLGNDELCVLLYKELYYRHIYSKLSPTLEDRLESWRTYVALFEYVLAEDSELDLPDSWLFDMIDEFSWQAMSFNHYRANVKKLSEEQRRRLAAAPDAWSVLRVIELLERLVAGSKVRQVLRQEDGERAVQSRHDREHVLLSLGYFALLGLSRVHVMLGDYRLAVETVQDISFFAADTSKALFTKVLACHISLYYYVGFSYLMMHRYADAVRALQTILVYLSRSKQAQSRSSAGDQVKKNQERLLSLLAIAVTLYPHALTDDVSLLLRGSDKLSQVRAGDVGAIEELFAHGSPKFIAAAPIDLEAGINSSYAAANFQQSQFMQQVKQQADIPNIRSYLKLYSSIGVPKLAALLQVEADKVRAVLLAYKAKMRSFEWDGGSPVQGSWKEDAVGEMNFFVERDAELGEDMVHITETKTHRNYIDDLLQGIRKVDSMLKQEE